MAAARRPLRGAEGHPGGGQGGSGDGKEVGEFRSRK